MVLLQTILILILVYYGIKILLKWLAPRLLNYAVKKTTQRFGEQFGSAAGHATAERPPRKSTVDKKTRPKSNPSKKVGEYIDFEEIE